MSAQRGYNLCSDEGSVQRFALMWWRLPAIFQGADEMFPWLAYMDAIFPFHIVWMELDLSCLPDAAIYISAFGVAGYSAPSWYCASPWLACPDALDSCVTGAPSYIRGNPKFPASELLGLPPAFTLVSCSAYLTLKMKGICSSERSGDFQQTTWYLFKRSSMLCTNMKSFKYSV
jgi:hypothetical protein